MCTHRQRLSRHRHKHTYTYRHSGRSHSGWGWGGGEVTPIPGTGPDLLGLASWRRRMRWVGSRLPLGQEYQCDPPEWARTQPAARPRKAHSSSTHRREGGGQACSGEHKFQAARRGPPTMSLPAKPRTHFHWPPEGINTNSHTRQQHQNSSNAAGKQQPCRGPNKQRMCSSAPAPTATITTTTRWGGVGPPGRR